MDSRPIGIFDSGLGGLTVLKEVVKLLPHEDIIYLGDTARVPYGTRSKDTVVAFALEDVDFLISKDVKCIVIACNTVSAQALKEIRDHVTIPVINVISAGVAACISHNACKKVGIMATRGTINSHAYRDSIKNLNTSIQIFEKACPLLVPVIEEGKTEGEIIDLLLNEYLSDFVSEGIDTLVLGCTHYPLIESSIRTLVGSAVTILNSGKEVAREVKERFIKNEMQNDNKRQGSARYFVTDVTSGFAQVAGEYLNIDVEKHLVKVQLP